MAATCMAVCKGSRKKIRGIFISSCHLPAAVECDIVILSEPGPNPTGPSWAVLQTQLIPARGRKLATGDIADYRTLTQLIPARGRKLFSVHLCLWIQHDTTYPREGTETQSKQHAYQINLTQLIPARGRKLLWSVGGFRIYMTQLIPARGRKPGKARRRPRTRTTQLIPARGRKLSLLIFYPPF